jgi:hypothetical protein
MKGAFNYVKKYVVKACDNSLGDLKGKKTLALSWFFQKRSFSLSGDLAKTYSDLIEEQYANSNRFHP